MADVTGAQWRKSMRSGNGGNCVEVATNLINTQGAVFVRDSKYPTGPALAFTPADWQAFIGGVQGGDFSL
ncbi:DUF397 domain-containing protein [Actinoplanes sp. NPDC051859]|uniref:DUF397 domain-containing protein n=1 Tax=Actinoplanes sp. NPDC051859 TaxID=3363909 RepID=UPI0037A53046